MNENNENPAPITDVTGKTKNIGEKVTDFVTSLMLIDRKIAANTIMVLMLVLGIVGYMNMRSQTLPNAVIPIILIKVIWQGATPEDVDKNIINAIEPEVRYIRGIKDIYSFSREGSGVIQIDFKDGYDMRKAFSEVENSVASITDLPSTAEKPIIQLIEFTDGVASIALIGEKHVSEKSLRKYAKQLQNGLIKAGAGIVELLGYRSKIVSVELDHLKMLKLGLTVQEIANVIRNNTLDRSTAIIEASQGFQIRTGGTGINLAEIADIPIIARKGGEKVLLGEIARVKTDYNERNANIFSQGKRTIILKVNRAAEEDALKIADITKKFVEEFNKELPANITADVYNYRSKIIRQRIEILAYNGLYGLVLVAGVLFIFLSARIAFWVAVGIPIAIVSSVAILFLVGETINMLSLFVMIMMLGITVDDAIIVGEHSHTLMKEGYSPRDATVMSVKRMFAPVLAAMLTTVAGFAPIFVISDIIGQIMFTIPLVVICVIIASTFEAFLILPGHIRHSYASFEKINNHKKHKKQTSVARLRERFDNGFEKLVEKFSKLVVFATAHPYINVVSSICILLISVAALAYGKVKFEFFPSPESESFYVDVYMQPGVSNERSEDIGNRAETDILKIFDQIEKPENEQLLVLSYVRTKFIGRGASSRERVSIKFQLTSSEERSVRTKTITKAIRKNLPLYEDVKLVIIGTPRGGPPGKDIEVIIKGKDNYVLKAAAVSLTSKIEKLPGASNISDNLPYGTKQLFLTLTPKAEALGFTTESITRQLRAEYEGIIARVQPSSDGGIDIRVKIADIDKSGIGTLEEHVLRAANGNLIQLGELAIIKEKDDFGILQRRAGERVAIVSGDLDVNVMSVIAISKLLENEILPGIRQKYGVQTEISGRDAEESKAFEDIGFGAIIAATSIYVIIALLFDNAFRPIAVMSIIPFGLVGAVSGHYIMGYNFTILSMIGVLALSGILVNGSIVYLNEFDFQRKKGFDFATALVIAAKKRSRAILMTSMTTIGGLSPLMFEKSLQAQFLIPMTVSIVFGLATATLLILLILPSVMVIGRHLEFRFVRIWHNISGKVAKTP